MRLRKIKKYGNTFVIPLTVTDMKDLKFKDGDQVDIERLVKSKRRKRK
ncbi:hypothetical protein LCGC14_0476300 [marine sediment metagenome]|uniref:SpoVT-AbrB domain-containing protein n=1 Tax=marine sediment metagenome TaxID=412755 RepID=A0A0F9STH2_9ZZZZ